MAQDSRSGSGSRDPDGVFETPEDVIRAADLTSEQKRTVLERWRQASGSPGTAEQGTGDDGLATRLARALAFLDSETGERKTTHDQGFYTAAGDAGKKTGE